MNLYRPFAEQEEGARLAEGDTYKSNSVFFSVLWRDTIL